MRRKDYLNYEFFEMLEDKSALAQMFNGMFKKLHLIRLISAPTSFKSEIGGHHETALEHFYQTCLFEVYAFTVISRLHDWTDRIDEYLNKYMGSWEYYARCKRIDLINEYGGDDSDYNEDGSLKTDVSKDDLLCYSIITYLIPEDSRDMFTHTVPEDMYHIMNAIRTDGSFSIQDMFKAIGGTKLKTYREENGEMVENSDEDELLNQIDRETKGEDTANLLFLIVAIIANLVDEVKNLPKDQDNREYFEKLPIRVQNILDLNLMEESRIVIEKYKGK